MKDKTKYFDYFFVFLIPLLSIIIEYLLETIKYNSFYQYVIYYGIGVVVCYFINIIRKKIFGIYFNHKK